MHRLAWFVMLAACAHAPDLPLRPDAAPPPGSTTEVFAAGDGTQLLARHWAATGETRGVLVIVHGLKDYSACYAHLASLATAAGFGVYAFDLRGHGRSAGPRVAPRHWTDYVDDLDRFLKEVEKREPGKKVFLFGHSMGGAIATRTAEVHEPKVAGLALSGPALAIDAPPLLLAVTKTSAALSPKAPALALDNKNFSSDPANAAVMDKDEFVSNPPAPARTAGGLISGIADIWRDVDRLTMPVLAMHGSADKLTAPSGSRALVEQAPALRRLRIYDGYFHDLLHEPGDRGARVETDLVTWLTAAASGAPYESPPPYRGHLAGDPHGWTQAIDVAGGVSTTPSYTPPGTALVIPGHTNFAGRIAIELARPRPIGFHGAITASTIGAQYLVALRPLGVAVHDDRTAFGLSAGAALLTNEVFAFSAGAWLERSLGPLHVSGFGEYARRNANVWIGGGSLRLGRDRAYWPHARAGVGPSVTGGAHCPDGGPCSAFVLLGLQLYGAD